MKYTLILLENYNNYFNRIIKHENYIEDYIKGRNYAEKEGINFNFNDGVNTEQIINWEYNWNPDYMLLVNEYGVILSKWFILETVWLRNGQYKLSLRNDVIVNNLDKIKGSPIFVEKSTLPVNDPLLYNSEGNSYNQIKVKETLLKDKTGIGWLVGYYNQNVKEDKNITGTFSTIGEALGPAIPIGEIDSRIILNKNGEKNATYIGSKIEATFGILAKRGAPAEDYFKFKSFWNNGFDNNKDIERNSADPRYGWLFTAYYSDSEFYPFNFGIENLKKTFENHSSVIQESFEYEFFSDNHLQESELHLITDYNNKIIEDTDGKRYQLKVEIEPNNEYKKLGYNSHATQTLLTSIKQDNLFYKADYNSNYNASLELTFTGYRYIVSLVPEEVSKDSITIKLSKARNHLNDAPFDMFIAPYDLNNVESRKIKVNGNIIKVNNLLTLASIRSMSVELGGTGSNKFIYDIQYLPYCPIPELIENYDEETKTFDLDKINGFTEGIGYDFINLVGKPESTKIGFIAWANSSSGTFNIPFNYAVANNSIDRKIENETTFLRLCSPNYNGVFEFSPAKNNGIRYFNVDYTYKPFAPYIHLNPDFGGIYGKDFNDNRGLIVGGDFSIPSISDEFVNYSLNNKNYQEIFNREISYMDYSHSLEMEQNKISLGINSVTGLVGGATAGSLAGPGGAVAGAVLGFGSTLAGGLTDLSYQEKAYRENKAFKTDMYNFNLGNIKARPQGISKTTPFTFNNKIFAFVEEYTSTDKEKEALRLKIQYNGMTTYKIDTLGNYINDNEPQFFKGQLIRIEELGDDYHIACAIYSELDKGVYL